MTLWGVLAGWALAAVATMVGLPRLLASVAGLVLAFMLGGLASVLWLLGLTFALGFIIGLAGRRRA